jgi:hypothetical protein
VRFGGAIRLFAIDVDPLVHKISNSPRAFVIWAVSGIGDLNITMMQRRRRRRRRILFVVVLADSFSFFQRQEHPLGKRRLAPRIVLSKDQQDVAGYILEAIIKVASLPVYVYVCSFIVVFHSRNRNEGRRPHDRSKGGVASVSEGTATDLVHLPTTKRYTNE